MQQPTKRLGELLVESGLITPAQLQSAITHQKIARGRLGSNLVALGYISEEVLMDFLSHQTGVPQMDVRSIDVPAQILKLVPHRLADQFTVLPVATKEPKSLVLAMSDPSDLNAIDSARFASGLHIEPVVASHSALRKAITELYRKVDPFSSTVTVEVGAAGEQDGALPVNFRMDPLPVPAAGSLAPAAPVAPASAFPRDPFWDGSTSSPTQPIPVDPFGFLDAPPAAAPPPPTGLVQASRTYGEALPRLEGYQTRTLVLGLIRLFQRRGIIGQDELQRLLVNLIEAGEIRDDDRVG